MDIQNDLHQITNFAYSKTLKDVETYTDLISPETEKFLLNIIHQAKTSTILTEYLPPFMLKLIDKDIFLFYYAHFLNYIDVSEINTAKFQNLIYMFRDYICGLMLNNYLCFCHILFPSKLILDDVTIFLCALMQAHHNQELYYPDSPLVINMPPRVGKSLFCHRYYMMWIMIKYPQSMILEMSSTKDSGGNSSDFISNFVNNTIVSDLYGDTFDNCSNTIKYGLKIPKGGTIKAFGVESRDKVGKDATLSILDDVNVVESFTPLTMKKASAAADYIANRQIIFAANEEQKKLTPIIVQQRMNKNDVTGFLLEAVKRSEARIKLSNNKDDKIPQFHINHIVHKCMDDNLPPFVVPRKEGLEDIVITRKDRLIGQYDQQGLSTLSKILGTPTFEIQYQQDVNSNTESSFSFEPIFIKNLEKVDIEYMFITTDFALTDAEESNYTCFCLWGIERTNSSKRANVYLLDLVYDKFHDARTPFVALTAFIEQNYLYYGDENYKSYKYPSYRTNKTTGKHITINAVFIETANGNAVHIANLQDWIQGTGTIGKNVEPKKDIHIYTIPTTAKKVGTSSDGFRRVVANKVERINILRGDLANFNIFIRDGINDEEFCFTAYGYAYQRPKNKYLEGIFTECANYRTSKKKDNTDDFLDNFSDAIGIVNCYLCI